MKCTIFKSHLFIMMTVHFRITALIFESISAFIIDGSFHFVYYENGGSINEPTL